VKKSKDRRTIQVWAEFDWLASGVPMGQLFATQVRGNETFSFAYDETWIASPSALLLDPSLQLEKGIQYADPQRGNFGLFLDSSPVLMQRRENSRARDEKRSVRTLVESDFLIGVHDLHRGGGLRFKTEIDGPFLDDDSTNAAPPWTSLRQLEQACRSIETEDEKKISAALRILLAPGSSLGGARPKASVVDHSGQLWIAKFPSREDRTDSGAWEMLLHELAKRSGIDVAPAKIDQFLGAKKTFLTKRFDRTKKGKRIHFSSAMNLLQRKDGDDASTGTSYLEIVELILQLGCQTPIDLEQLWRRIVFSICVSNTDDHLRNHGFLLRPQGWQLSPAYDLNPVATGDGLKLNISETDNAQDLDLALSQAKVFRIKLPKAKQIINDVVKAVKKWRARALALGISRSEQEAMSRAFRVAELWDH
jgi:serine/threonine-protein kinase HipA